jgi:peptidoglycan/LPS O-acetylase OafA/YrhL
MLGHICVMYAHHDWTRVFLWLDPLAAVYGFLFISGYSIAHSITIKPSGYIKRRCIRILPLYYASIVFALFVSLLIPHGHALVIRDGAFFWRPSLLQLAACLLMLQGTIATSIPVDNQLWTLGVEWWCYMAAPSLKRFGAPLVLCIGLASYVGFLVHLRHGVFGSYPYATDGAAVVGLTWMWIAGYAFYMVRTSWLRVLILFCPVLLGFEQGAHFGPAMLIAAIAMRESEVVILPQRLVRTMNWFGDLSYPLYLFHHPMLLLLARYRCENTYVGILCSLAVSVAALYSIDYRIRKRSPKHAASFLRDKAQEPVLATDFKDAEPPERESARAKG